MNPSFKRTLDSINNYRDSNNPLRGLTMPRAVSLMESAQRGQMADLQWLYAAETGIEATDPDLMAIIERTTAGIATLDWQIIEADERAVGFDKALAEDQAAFLRESYSQCDNLEDALEHLVMARFRGFAHLQPWISPDWSLEHLEPLPQWNMVRNGTRDEWAWNPRAQQTMYAALQDKLTPEDYIVLNNKRPVNRIALIKYVRSTTAEKDWDAYVEIYGIPGVFIIQPQSVPSGKEEEYADMAEKAAAAASGTLPFGSQVTTLSEARSVQPFQTRLEWLQKQLVLAGTGGLLTMLTESGSGTLAGGAHSSTWNMIIERTASIVTRPLNMQYEKRALNARFPGRPVLAKIQLRAEQEKDVTKAIANIASLSQFYVVDAQQVESETGYKVTLKPDVAQPVAAFRAKCRQPQPQTTQPDMVPLFASFAADLAPWRKDIETFLQAPGKDAATALLEKIKAAQPKDSQFAKELEKLLAQTYTEAVNAK